MLAVPPKHQPVSVQGFRITWWSGDEIEMGPFEWQAEDRMVNTICFIQLGWMGGKMEGGNLISVTKRIM